jgi:hypothetical protein
MLELPGQPILDKTALIGACMRLPLRFDAARLQTEIDALPLDFWGTQGGRVGVHRTAEAVFLRGYAPAEGNLPIEDRPALGSLSYVREIIEARIPATAQRCLLARLPGGAHIAPHIDRAIYFAQTIRLHLPVTTHAQAFMICNGLSYVMQPGELWALNNNAVHGVWNADENRSRTHLIVDMLPSEGLRALLAAGERDLGALRRDVDSALLRLTRLRSAH